MDGPPAEFPTLDGPLRPETLQALDGMLHSYWSEGIDWRARHAVAILRDPTLTPMQRPYWVPADAAFADQPRPATHGDQPQPMTHLAFWGAPARARVGADPATPPLLLTLMAADPDVTVVRAVASNPNTPAGAWASAQAAHATPQAGPETPQEQGTSPARTVLVALAVIGVLLLLIGLLNPVRWTKVDVPEQPETFRTESYRTGLYTVRDAGRSPCHKGQGWGACINLMVDEYNRACTLPLDPTSRTLCNVLSTDIERMKAEDGPGAIVDEVGGRGTLEVIPQVATREVPNGDHRPAITHEAVCYFGFLGECPPQ